MSSSWNLEWLNLNANRAYPFKEDMPLTDNVGFATIPNSLITDLVLVVAADLSAVFHVSTILYSGNTLMVAIADDTNVTVTSVTIDINSHNANDGYNLIGVGDYEDARGRIVFGDLTSLNLSLPEGAYQFDASSTELEARTVRPDIRSVRSLQVRQSDGSSSAKIAGIIELIAGTNVRLTYVPGSPAAIRIDAISGEGLNEECECDKMFIPPPPIRSINGVVGDENGDITISAIDSCIEISPAGSGITIKDTCAKPCCGCPELEFITEKLSLIDASIVTLTEHANLLETNQINFYNSVLGSIL